MFLDQQKVAKVMNTYSYSKEGDLYWLKKTLHLGLFNVIVVAG